MTRSWFRSLALPAGVVCFGTAVALAGLVGCASREERLDQARRHAIAYFEDGDGPIDPGWSVVFPYLHRRFDLTVTTASGKTLHDATEGVERPEIFAVVRRLVDPAATTTRQEVAALPTAIDRISATALHCDRIGLPEDWVEVLENASQAGAYALTHAVAAAEWTLENRCLPELALASLRVSQVHLLEKLIEERDLLGEQHELSTDIWIEAIAMLYYTGAGARVQSEWIDAMLDLQRPDGGWPNHPDATASHPHPTTLALWVVLETENPSAKRVSWVPRGPLERETGRR